MPAKPKDPADTAPAPDTTPDLPPAPADAYYFVNGNRIPVAIRTEPDGTLTLLREGAVIVTEAQESTDWREGYFVRSVASAP